MRRSLPVTTALSCEIDYTQTASVKTEAVLFCASGECARRHA